MPVSLSGHLQNAWRARWPQWGVTFLLWALAAWSAAFWALRLAQPLAVPAGAPPALQTPELPDPEAVGRLLGSAASPEANAGPRPGRLALAGVVAGRSGGGSALIAVDGGPPRPYRVGMRVHEGLWLLSVQPRRAQLGPTPRGPPTLTLELPAPVLLEIPRTP